MRQAAHARRLSELRAAQVEGEVDFAFTGQDAPEGGKGRVTTLSPEETARLKRSRNKLRARIPKPAGAVAWTRYRVQLAGALHAIEDYKVLGDCGETELLIELFLEA